MKIHKGEGIIRSGKSLRIMEGLGTTREAESLTLARRRATSFLFFFFFFTEKKIERIGVDRFVGLVAVCMCACACVSVVCMRMKKERLSAETEGRFGDGESQRFQNHGEDLKQLGKIYTVS